MIKIKSDLHFHLAPHRRFAVRTFEVNIFRPELSIVLFLGIRSKQL